MLLVISTSDCIQRTHDGCILGRGEWVSGVWSSSSGPATRCQSWTLWSLPVTVLPFVWHLLGQYPYWCSRWSSTFLLVQITTFSLNPGTNWWMVTCMISLLLSGCMQENSNQGNTYALAILRMIGQLWRWPVLPLLSFIGCMNILVFKLLSWCTTKWIFWLAPTTLILTLAARNANASIQRSCFCTPWLKSR